MAANSDSISHAEVIRILDYSADSTSPASRGMRFLLIIASLPLILVPFIPFTYGVAPVVVLFQLAKQDVSGWTLDSDLGIALLALPFFLGIPIWLLHIRLLVSPRITTAEKMAVTSMGVFCILMTLIVVGHSLYVDFNATRSFNEWGIVLIGPGIILVGSLANWWFARRHCGLEMTTKGWLYTGFLANAGMCLAGFESNRGPGWYLTAVTSFVMTVEFIWIAVVGAKPRRWARS